MNEVKLRKSYIIVTVLLLTVILAFWFLLSGYHAASKPVSYLPDIQLIKSGLNKCIPSKERIEVKNSWFVLSVDMHGNIIVKTPQGDTILSDLAFYSEYEGTGINLGLEDIRVSFLHDTAISIHGKNPSDVLINLAFKVYQSIPRIDIDVNVKYNSELIVKRESVIARFNIPVTEVYLKNRKTDSVNFDSEYWLQRQGVRFGNGSRSALIYHTPGISSLQLSSEGGLLFINLEYYLDHPFVHIPFQEDGGSKWADLSSAKYDTGDQRNNSFSIYFGYLPQATPRLMLVPYGFLAGHVFTEHADGGNIRNNRAAYFGSEDILDINKATGGFAGYKIPVTKSIFYTDSSGSLSDSFTGNGTEWIRFLDFLDQLNKSGIYDICLHTPEDQNSSRQMIERSVQFMKNRFNTSTWIDHGMYSGKTNRESFVCDMLDPASDYYSADLMDKYNIRYFWSPAVEMIRNSSGISLTEELKHGRFYSAYLNLWKSYLSPEEIKDLNFFRASKELIRRYSYKFEMNSLNPDRGNAFPTPLYWRHPTRTNDFYSWTTEYVKSYGINKSTGSHSDILKKDKVQLDLLVKNWGVFINHGYFVRNRIDDGTLSENNGKIVIDQNFNNILELMDRMRDEGNLYLTTIRDLLDYWIQTDNVTFDYIPRGDIYIHNNNDKEIKGLSLSVKADSIMINGRIPASRKIGDDTVIWFDIPAKTSVCLNLK